MYILVRDSVPDSLVPVTTAHASLACYKKYEQDPDMIQWINSVFKKVVCRVSDREFEKAKEEPKQVLLTESALGGVEVCIAFCPRENYGKAFKFYRMWAPKQDH